MSTVGQIEKRTQARVVQLFQDQLGYDYLGNWIDRPEKTGKLNANIEPDLLRPFLEAKLYAPALITKAIAHLTKVATDQSRSLYDINRDVYDHMPDQLRAQSLQRSGIFRQSPCQPSGLSGSAGRGGRGQHPVRTWSRDPAQSQAATADDL